MPAPLPQSTMYEILCFELNKLVAVQYGDGHPTSSYVELCARYIPPQNVFKSETLLQFGNSYCIYSHGSTMVQLITDIRGDIQESIYKGVNGLYSSCRQCATVIPSDRMNCYICTTSD